MTLSNKLDMAQLTEQKTAMCEIKYYEEWSTRMAQEPIDAARRSCTVPEVVTGRHLSP